MSQNDSRLKLKCGNLQLENPFLLASGPPTAEGDFIRKALSLGWGGAVTKTINPDSIEVADVSPRFGVVKGGDGAIVGFENIELISKKPVAYWQTEVEKLKKEYPRKVLIASIMADREKGSWQTLARQMEHAGADALELNFSCPHGMPEQGLGSAIGQDPEITATITRWVKEAVKIPVIVKLSPNVTDIQIIARAAVDAGADMLAAINTVQCLIGVDLDSLDPVPSVEGYSTFGGYSGYAIKPIGLRCVAQIAQCVAVPIMGMGGICSWRDAAEYLAAGAGAVQVCTEVMLKGVGIIRSLQDGLRKYLVQKGFESPEPLVAAAVKKLGSHEQLSRRYAARANWAAPENCSECGKCVSACGESGYQAITLEDHQVIIDNSRCDGCSLCSHVCATGAIQMRPAHLH
ncbi:MAG: NAD-dependent dihydropyrimidine dehydrogenase subunit PreA [Syntrophorhabdales bacterium]|jgi:dihydropyrimidine dehydrogenase (NAD+) subunit PreA